MAEASERPAEAGVPTLEAPQVYRPLSLLAVLGLGLSVLYGLVVLVGGLLPFAQAYPRSFVLLLLLAPVVGGLGAVLARQRGPERVAAVAGLALAVVVALLGWGGLVAFSGTSPWMLDWWAWMLLIFAVLVNLIARSRIRAAEGTVAGGGIARVGLWVGVIFGFTYLVYVAGNLWAVAGQAQVVADRYLDLIREDKLPQAFVETLRPGTRPDSSGDLRRSIEIEYNTPRGMREPGQFTTFATSDLVQFIRLGGPDTTWRYKSGSSEFSQGGYKATLTYEVKNKLARFDAEVAAQSIDSGGRRVWFILLGFSRIKRETMETAAEGDEMMLALQQTSAVARSWVSAVQNDALEAAFFATIPPAERRRLEAAHVCSQPELAAAAGLAPLGALANRGGDREALEKGMSAFRAGKLIDAAELIGEDKVRGEAVSDVRAWLNRKISGPVSAEALGPVQVPNYRRGREGVEVDWPIRISFVDAQGKGPRLIVDAEVICRGPAGKVAADQFQVAGLRLLRAVTSEAPPLRQVK